MAEAEMRQFGTRGRKPIPFRIDDDVFHAHPAMAAGTMMNMAGMKEQMNSATMEDKLNVILKAFEPMLVPESYELMAERLVSNDNPVGLTELLEVFEWLVGEVYAKRPTKPSKPSGNSSQKSNAGKSSTAGARPETSTPSNSPGTDLST
jgi:hypothetical protein